MKYTYILTDTPVDGYWFGQYPTVEAACLEAHKYPKAAYILEYRDAGTRPAMIAPTGRSLRLDDLTNKEQNHE